MANTLTFANQTLTDADIFGGITFSVDLNAGEEFTIGNTASASVSFVTDVQLPLYSKDATNGTFTWSKDGVSRGRYYITEVTKESSKYTVTAYDAMSLLDVVITNLNITYPVTASTLATLIATYIGCTVSGTIYNGSLTVSEIDELTTIRTVLGYIAEASGCSVKIDGSDHLCFMYYANSGTTISASEYVTLNVADYTCAPIDGVTIFNSSGAIQATAGTGTNMLYIGQNPFLESATASNAQTILARVSGFSYAPLKCDLFNDDDIEVGTIVTFGSTPTLVMHVDSSESGATASSVGTDTRAGYNKSALEIVGEAKAIAVDAQGAASAVAGVLADMQTAAAAAGTTLEGIYQTAVDAEQSASDAQTAADSAKAAAGSVLTSLSVVEDVVGTVTWLANHGYYVLSEDDSVVANKVYYTVTATAVSSPMGNPSRRLYYERSGSGTTADPYIYVKSTDTAVVSGKTYYTLSASSVSEPSGSPADNLYYELALDEAVGNYIATHLALTDNGLDLYGSDTMGRLRLTANGIEIYGAGSQSVIAEYGSTTRLGSATGKHVTIDSANGFVFWAGDENNAANKVAWFTDNQLNIPNAIVSDTIETGHWRWDASSSRTRLDLKYIG